MAVSLFSRLCPRQLKGHASDKYITCRKMQPRFNLGYSHCSVRATTSGFRILKWCLHGVAHDQKLFLTRSCTGHNNMCDEAEAAQNKAPNLAHSENKRELGASQHVALNALVVLVHAVSERCTILLDDMSKILVSLHYVDHEVVAAHLNHE